MTFEEYTPTEVLKPFIKTYKIIESENEMTNRVLPNTSLAIAFRYKGQVSYTSDNKQDRLPTTTISGLRKSVRLIHYLKDTATIIVLFNETGLSAFFKEPLHELFEKSISLDTLIKRHDIARIEEQLAEAKHNTERIAIIETFLRSKLDNYRPDQLVSTAIEKIRAAKGLLKIRDLSETLYISNDAFEKRFRKVIGASPKQFSSIIRLELIARQKQSGESFTDLAFHAGYYDQPHFNKDFKLFTGLTPKEFYKSTAFW